MTDKIENAALVKGDLVLCSNEAGEAMDWVRLARYGDIGSVNAKQILNAESWSQIEKNFRGHGTSIVVDLEHETNMDGIPPKDQLGAVGRVTDLRFDRQTGLEARINWNEEGRTRIKSDRWCYLSPTFYVRKNDSVIMGLDSVGLVNKPAISRSERVTVNSADLKDEQRSNASQDSVPLSNAIYASRDGVLREIAAMLGISAEVDGSTLLAAIRDKIKSMSPDATATEVVKSARKALDLAATAGESEIVVAINTLKHVATVNAELEKQVNSLRGELATLQANRVLEPFIASNLIDPNDAKDMQHCSELAKTNPELLANQMSKRKPYGQPHRTTPPTERQMLIANASREYRETPGHQKATSLKAFVNQTLRDKGAQPLGESEERELVIA